MDRRISSIAVAGVLASLVLVGSAAGATAGSSGAAQVVGSYKYTTFNGGHRQASIAAFASDPVTGVWTWQDWRGPVTCLVVDGNEAWLAGPNTTEPETGVFMHVVDAGNPGPAGDLVTTWGQDPGQPFEELLGWCESMATDVPLFEVQTGNVTVR